MKNAATFKKKGGNESDIIFGAHSDTKKNSYTNALMFHFGLMKIISNVVNFMDSEIMCHYSINIVAKCSKIMQTNKNMLRISYFQK